MARRFAAPLLILALAAAALVAPARAADEQKLLRDYTFKNGFKDDTKTGPELKSLNGTLNDGNYTFGAGQGLHLEKPGVTDEYAVEITFKLDTVDDWRKLIDFKNQQADEGLYVFNGQLQFYDVAIGGQLQAGQEYTVRLERNKTTRTVTAFINGQKTWDFMDANDDAVFGDAGAFFFQDDMQTNDEVSAGVVTHIRVWDHPAK